MSEKPEYHLTIKDMPPDQRPRERLFVVGPESLSNTELLAILLRTGTVEETSLDLAKRILNQNGGLRFLAESDVEQLKNIHGVGTAKAAQIKAAVELGKRIFSISSWESPSIKSPQDAANLLMDSMRYLDREHFKVVYLNSKNRVLGVDLISIGTLNASLVHPRELFKKAVVRSAAGIILVHNHPSGDPHPSEEDKLVTKRMVEAGEIIGIEVLDHIIIGDGIYVSLREMGCFTS
ncbi:MAG: DNA repair protein RadC [Clostridia bacterium 41_269]|nr:MAG: DNA repair protein RadC [Clostridia bacterium 41_269]